MKRNIELTRQLLSVLTAGVIAAVPAAYAAGGYYGSGTKAGETAPAPMGGGADAGSSAKDKGATAKDEARTGVRTKAGEGEMNETADTRTSASDKDKLER